MTTTIKTKASFTKSARVDLKDILKGILDADEELRSFTLLSATTSALGPGKLEDTGYLTLAFSRTEEDEKELKAEVPADELSQQREIVRAALGTASTFYTGATPEDQAKVEEAIITAWKDSGTSDLSEFALPYYRAELRYRYNTSTDRFEFAEPVKDLAPAFTQEQRDEVRRVLVSNGSDSFMLSTPEVQELVITRCLEMLDGKPFSYRWYLYNVFYNSALYNQGTQKFSFAPWQPAPEQVAEARDILSIRIPFGQLSEDDKSTAVLEVLRKWHEDGEKAPLRQSELYANYFRGSELYLTTEFGKENQGRI